MMFFAVGIEHARSTWRFRAFTTPIRARLVGPTRVRAMGSPSGRSRYGRFQRCQADWRQALPRRLSGIKCGALRRSLQLSFRVQNDIVEQTSRDWVRSFLFQNAVALHLISTLLPVIVPRHGPILPAT